MSKYLLLSNYIFPTLQSSLMPTLQACTAPPDPFLEMSEPQIGHFPQNPHKRPESQWLASAYTDLHILMLCSNWHMNHTTHCTMYTAHCTLHAAYCTLHTAHCKLHNVHCILHTTHCTLNTTHCTLHTVDCTLYTSVLKQGKWFMVRA